ncbi:hypothetical protein [Tissierella sp.]|uniref:hypothetical protein n=1 Tax=Tissierella sp. TaxID=41274 RepID=UPI00285EC628|nr:hypothetical protein [Tissierella sp.]MDR7856449.1 hypothetical protein [Tissierella sp.]
MEILQDFLLINKKTIKKTITSLLSNLPIILTGIVYIAINLVIYRVVLTLFTGVLSIFAGIILAIFSASMISNYLYLLFNIINYNKITFQDFKDGFKYFLRKIYTIFFFAWIGSFLLDTVTRILGPNGVYLSIIVSISVLVILNALPETLYLKTLEPMDSIMYAVDFMKENWLNWLIPNVVLYIALFFLTGSIITDLFATHIFTAFSLDIVGIIKYLLGQGIFSFLMIYRGHLYKLLSTSTRRKRMYMNKF